jgi:hypothetical protein
MTIVEANRLISQPVAFLQSIHHDGEEAKLWSLEDGQVALPPFRLFNWMNGILRAARS